MARKRTPAELREEARRMLAAAKAKQAERPENFIRTLIGPSGPIEVRLIGLTGPMEGD